MSLQPIPKPHQFRSTQVIGVDIRGIFAGDALVVFGHLAVIHFQAVQLVAAFRIRVGPDPGLGLHGLVEVRRAGIRRNHACVKVVGLHRQQPIGGRPDRLFRFTGMTDGHEGLDLEMMTPGDVHAASVVRLARFFLNIREDAFVPGFKTDQNPAEARPVHRRRLLIGE